MTAKEIVDSILGDDPKTCTAAPITGVDYNGHSYTFYPYAGHIQAWQYPEFQGGQEKGGLLGFIKTRQGKVHGRFYTQGQFFKFEPGQ